MVVPGEYLGEDLAEVISSPYPWQQEVNAMLNKKPHPREITWIFDPIGGNGKSKLAKSWVYNGTAHMLSWDPQRDLFYARQQNKEKNVILFDITRAVPEKVDMNEFFSTVEQLKNGLCFSGKYESGDVITPIPHIVMFSNQLPPNPSLLSLDRWQLKRIGAETKRLYNMSVKQANDFILDYQEWEKKQAIKKAQKNKDKKSQDKKEKEIKVKSKYQCLFSGPNDSNVYKPSVKLLVEYGN